jgi:inosine/xanthosine triphosphate pyrophosphatase family protein
LQNYLLVVRGSDPQITSEKIKSNKLEPENKIFNKEMKSQKNFNKSKSEIPEIKDISNVFEENIYIKVESNLGGNNIIYIDSNIFTEQILQSDADILSNLNDDNEINKIFNMVNIQKY